MNRHSLQKQDNHAATLCVSHIREWLEKARLGDRRVVARDPLCEVGGQVVLKCRELGMVNHDRGRWVLEKIYSPTS